jgi:D-glycero-D-manno-heptose 1,7-bisphosphate phosphatase
MTSNVLRQTSIAKHRAVFLDRDGVINELVYHQEQEVIDSPFTVNQFKLLPGVPEAIKLIHQAGYLAVLISNQPGLAKEHMTQETFSKIKHKMKTELSKFGEDLDAEYYCLHHPDAIVKQYKVKCDCRKPRPGLILKAAQEMDIDLQQSWMVGDNLSDIQAGKSAGCKTILLGKMKCELCHLMENRKIIPDQISDNLPEAVRVVMLE